MKRGRQYYSKTRRPRVVTAQRRPHPDLRSPKRQGAPVAVAKKDWSTAPERGRSDLPSEPDGSGFMNRQRTKEPDGGAVLEQRPRGDQTNLLFEKPVPDGWTPTNRRSSPLVPGAARAFGVALIIRPAGAAPTFRYVPCRLPAWTVLRWRLTEWPASN